MNYNSLYLTLVDGEGMGWARRESNRTWSFCHGEDRAWLQQTNLPSRWLLATDTESEYVELSEYEVFATLDWF